MSNKSKIIISSLIVLVLIFLIVNLFVDKKTPSLEEVKKDLSLTKTITVYKIEPTSNEFKYYKSLEKTSDIKNIISILSNSQSSDNEWELLVGHTYKLELIDKENKVISEISINLSSSSEIKYKSYKYNILITDPSQLQKIIES